MARIWNARVRKSAKLTCFAWLIWKARTGSWKLWMRKRIRPWKNLIKLESKYDMSVVNCVSLSVSLESRCYLLPKYPSSNLVLQSICSANHLHLPTPTQSEPERSHAPSNSLCADAVVKGSLDWCKASCRDARFTLAHSARLSWVLKTLGIPFGGCSLRVTP